MSSVLLPFELVDNVVGMTSNNNDNATLRACALVSQTWRDATRPYIFRKIKIADEPLLAALEALVTVDSTVGLLVRELTVQPRTQQEHTPSSWLSRFPTLIPSYLTRLQTIQFIDLFEFGEYCNESFFREYSKFTSVERLIFHNCSLDLHLIYSYTCALPNVRHLQVGSTLPLPSMLSEPPPQLHSPRLSSIKLNLGQAYPMALEEILVWALASPSKESLRALSVSTRIVESTAVGNFIREIGGSLQHLDLHLAQSFGSPIEYDFIKTDISLTSCTALCSLSVHDSNPTLPAFVAFLSEISSPHLRKLSLWVTSDNPDPGSLPDFRLLVEQLDSQHLRCLEEICFIYQGPLRGALVLEKLQKDLHNVDTRGILRLVMA